jgi:hypothetical protein
MQSLTPQDKAAYLAHKPRPGSSGAAFHAYVGCDPTFSGGNQDEMFPSPHTHAPAWETSPPSDPHALLNELWTEYLLVTPDQATDPKIAGLKVTLNALRSAVSWSELSQALLSSTSAKLRSRAYAALAYVSGTKVLGHQTDQLGRPGIAISRTIKRPSRQPDPDRFTEHRRSARGDGDSDLTTCRPRHSGCDAHVP